MCIRDRVREHSISKIPIIAVVGEKEVKSRSLNVRRLGIKESQKITLDDAIRKLSVEATPPDLKLEKENGDTGIVTK